MYTYRLLCKNPMVPTKRKSIIDEHTKKKKESEHNTKDGHQITKKENKSR